MTRKEFAQMKNKRLNVLLLAGAFALLAGAASAQGVVYVIPTEATLRSGDGLGGPAVATVRQGTALTVVREDGLRVLVKTSDGKQGWVPKRQVQNAPPDKGRGLGGLVVDDRSVRESRTATANRGLVRQDAQQTALQPGTEAAAIQSVRSMESLAASLTETDIDQFLREGGLNP